MEDATEALYLQVKELWLLAHDLVDRARTLTFTSPSGVAKYRANIEKATTQCSKISNYIVQVKQDLFFLEEKMENLGFKLKEPDDRPTTRKYDSSARPTQSRQDSDGKQVSRFNPLAGD